MNKIKDYPIKPMTSLALSKATYLWTSQDGYVVYDPVGNIIAFTLTKQDAKILVKKMIQSHNGTNCPHCQEDECYLDCTQDLEFRNYLTKIVDAQYESEQDLWKDLKDDPQ